MQAFGIEGQILDFHVFLPAFDLGERHAEGQFFAVHHNGGADILDDLAAEIRHADFQTHRHAHRGRVQIAVESRQPQVRELLLHAADQIDGDVVVAQFGHHIAQGFFALPILFAEVGQDVQMLDDRAVLPQMLAGDFHPGEQIGPAVRGRQVFELLFQIPEQFIIDVFLGDEEIVGLREQDHRELLRLRAIGAFADQLADDFLGFFKRGGVAPAVPHGGGVVQDDQMMGFAFAAEHGQPGIQNQPGQKRQNRQHNQNPQQEQQKLLEQQPPAVSLLGLKQKLHRRKPHPAKPHAVDEMDDDRRSHQRAAHGEHHRVHKERRDCGNEWSHEFYLQQESI